MSDQTSIFNGDSNNQATPGDQNNGQGSNQSGSQNSDPIANLLGSIKNEKGEPKYKSLEDALVALQHSQTYIPQLTDKLKERETELANAKLEAAKITELEKSLQALTLSNGDGGNTNAPAMSEEKIADIVSKTLNRNQQEAISKQNLTSVVEAMQGAFGDNAEKVFYDKAKDLGMSVEEFNKLAARTPKAVLDLIGVKATQNPQGSNKATQSSVNSGGFAPNQQTFIGRNTVPTLIGATSQDLMNESAASKKMVEELHASGKSMNDLSDPKVYMKMFSK